MNKKNFIEKVVIDRETNELNLFDLKIEKSIYKNYQLVKDNY